MPLRKPREDIPAYVKAHQEQAVRSFDEFPTPVVTIGETSARKPRESLPEFLIRFIAACVNQPNRTTNSLAREFGLTPQAVRWYRYMVEENNLVRPRTIAQHGTLTTETTMNERGLSSCVVRALNADPNIGSRELGRRFEVDSGKIMRIRKRLGEQGLIPARTLEQRPRPIARELGVCNASHS